MVNFNTLAKTIIFLLVLILGVNMTTLIVVSRWGFENSGLADATTIPETEVSDSVSSVTTPGNNSIPKPEETIHTRPTETIPEATDSPEPTETVSVIDPNELEMLACVIYQEAGADRCCDDCRRRVADVVLNRIADPRFPNTMYDVLTAENQYGKYYWTGIVWPDYASDPYEKNAIERAYRIAREVLSGQHSELYGNGYVWQASFKQSNDYIYCCGCYYGR